MTPERWKQVSQLYDAALAHRSDERAAFLAEACAGDAALRDEVQSVLDQPTSSPQLDGVATAVVKQPCSSVTARRSRDVASATTW